MNKIYRLVWNELTSTWIAVAEHVRAHGKRASGVLMLSVAGSVLAGPLASDTLPSGGLISGGSAAGSISSTGSNMVVTQNVANMIANWNTFNIGANASVVFVQPASTSIALNRVLSQDPSQILGSLSANGRVMLVNPAGIVFAQGSQVNVGSLVASTLGISDSNFLNGNYSFANSGRAGSILSQGQILADGGVVALIAPQVNNSGRIRTTGGSALLAGADKVSIDFAGDGLITYSLDAGAAQALVDNSGSIVADGGLAVLSSKAADAVSQAVVNNTGLVRARTLGTRGGRVLLLADMDNGEVQVGGELDASAPNGGNGGFIETSGHVVTLNAANIHAGSAIGSGGTWLIDPQDLTIDATGAGNIASALNTGTSVTATTSACSSSYGSCSGTAGNLTLASSIAKVSGNAASLTLIADGFLQINSGVRVSDTSSSGALSLNLQATGPIRFADNSTAVSSVDIQGNLYLGGKSGGATNATGNSVYADGIYIGSNTTLQAASLSLRGQGAAGATASAGGSGVKLASGASLISPTGTIDVTGIGGAGGAGSTGATGGADGSGSGTAGSSGTSGGSGGDGITLAAAARLNGANLVLSGTGGSGGSGGTGGVGGNATNSYGYTGGVGGAGGIGGSGGSGVVVGAAANLEATAGTLNTTATGGKGGAGGSGGMGGNGSDNSGVGSAGAGGKGGIGGKGGSGGGGVVQAASTMMASNGIVQTATGGAGGQGGVGGRGGSGGNTGGSDGGNGGTGGNGGNGGVAGSGFSLGNGASVVADAGTIILTNSSGGIGVAGSGGNGGYAGHGKDIWGNWIWASGGGSGSAGSSGATVSALNAAGAGYIGSAGGVASSADITFINDSMSLGTLAVASSGMLNIRSKTASTLIDLGTYTSNSAHLQLGQSAFWNGTSGNFRNGFSSITVGSATQSGAISASGLSYADALSLQAGGSGGTVTVTGAVTDAGSGDLSGALTLSAAGAVTVSGAVGTHNQAVNVSAASYTQGDVDIASGSGEIVIAADAVALNANTGSNSLQTSGALTLKTKSAATAMSLAGGAAFDLSSTEIGYLKNSGASSITIGRSDATGSMTIGSAVNLAGKNVTLAVGSITDGGNSRVITADTLKLVANGTIGGSASNYAIDFLANTVSANTTGNGSAYLTSTAGYALETSNLGSGTLSLATTGTGGSIVQSGTVTAGTLTATLAGTTSVLDLDNKENAIGNLAGITAGGGFSLDNGNNATTLSGNLTTSGGNGAVSIDTGTGTYTQNTNVDIASGSGAITLTADNMVINSNSGNNALNTTGALTLQTATAARGITLGGSTESAGQLVLQSSELSAFGSSAPSSVTIGRNDATGAMSIASTVAIASPVLNLNAGSIGGDTANTLTVNGGSGTLNLAAHNSGGNIGSSAGPLAFSAASVSVRTSGDGSAYLASNTGYGLASSDVGNGVLSLSAVGNVTQSGALTAGELALQLSGSLTFGQSGNRIAALSGSVGSDLVLRSATGLAVNATTIGGNLDLTVGGDVSNAGTLTVAGNTSVDAGSNDVSLARSGNSLTGAVSVKADDFSLRNALPTVLGALDLSGNLGLTSSGAVSQTVAARVAGTTSVSAAGQNVSLDKVGNDFTGAVGVSGANVAIASSGDLHLASSTASGTFTAVAGGTAGTGDLYLDNGTTITSGNDKNTSGTVNSVVLVAGDGNSRFLNNAGENAIKLAYGSDSSRSRWLVYTNDPYHNPDVLGGLKSYNEAIYATYYPGHAAGSAGSVALAPGDLAASGNRYVLKTLLTGIPGYDDSSVKVSVIASNKTYGDTMSLTTADNTSIVYASGTMSFDEFSDPKPVWLDISGLSLSSAATVATTHVGSYDITAAGSLIIGGNSYNIGTLGASGSSSWSTTTDGTYTLNFVDTSQIAVTPRALGLSVSGGAVADKVYDGTTLAAFSSTPVFALSNVVNGDTVTLGGTATGQFEDKNVGVGKTVILSGLTVSSSDYVLPDILPSYTGTITARSITVAATGDNKVYDATNSATATLAASASASAGTAGSGYILGDKLAYTYSNAVFDAGKNAGNGKAVTVNGIALSGEDAGNYVLTSITAATTADIAKRSIALSGLGGSKEYDGTTALASATVTVDTSSVLGSDEITGASGAATFDTRNAGSGKTLTTDLSSLRLAGADADNYTLGTGSYSGSGSITPKAVTLVAGSVSKGYDATADYTTQAADLAGLSSQLGVAGDRISAATISYANANAGSGKAVTLDTVSVDDGNNGGNYAITLLGNSSSNIDKAIITVSTGNVAKTYDGTTSAIGSGVVVSGRLYGSDTLDDSGLTYAFADKNAGTGKTVNVGGSASVADGNSGGNYTVNLVDNTGSSIDKAALSVTAAAVSKVYDGTTTASGSASVGALANGDLVGTNATQRFTDKNVGAGKTVNASGLVIVDGNHDDMTGNYEITYVANNNGEITPRTLNVSYVGQDKIYDGTTAATVLKNDDRIAGDLLTVDATAAFADKNVGTAKSVAVSGVSLSGSDAGNYTVATTGSTSAAITPRTLNVSYVGQDKTYDGTTAATVLKNDDRIAGDLLTVDATAAFADKNVGTAKSVAVSGVSLSGSDAGNYAVATTGSTSAAITPRTLNVSYTGLDKVYDGTRGATVVSTDDRIAGDALVINANAAFADKNVGVAKTVSVSGAVLSGSDASNYVLAASAGTTASISQRTLNVTYTGQDKVYDGTTLASVQSSDDRVAGDALTLAWSAAFADPAIGVNKLISVNTLALGGADAGNYTMALTGGARADITPAGTAYTPPGQSGVPGAGTPSLPVADSGGVFTPPVLITPSSGTGNGASTPADGGIPRTAGEAALAGGTSGGASGDSGDWPGGMPGQFVTVGDTTTLTASAVGDRENSPALRENAPNAEHAGVRSTLVLFSQFGDQIIALGTFNILDRGQSLQASNAAAATTGQPNLDLATVRFVQINYPFSASVLLPVMVGVSADGVLFVKVSASARALMEEKSLVLLGLSIAKRRFSVSPDQIKYVVIQPL